jgi:Uncharacterized protein conserved in bacteria
MVLLDTHIWVWWVHGDANLDPAWQDWLDSHAEEGFGISAISCWEIAKLVEYGRLALPCSVPEWFNLALAYPGIRLLGLTPAIAYESTALPPGFHRDPADQIIVATARVHGLPLLTADAKIVDYPHVETLKRG